MLVCFVVFERAHESVSKRISGRLLPLCMKRGDQERSTWGLREEGPAEQLVDFIRGIAFNTPFAFLPPHKRAN